MKPIEFLNEAKQEIIETAVYYEEQTPYLGLKFLEELSKFIKLIKRFPKAWPIKDHFRFCLINRFPFGIYYLEEKTRIIIVAVANLKRKPGYWKNRN